MIIKTKLKLLSAKDKNNEWIKPKQTDYEITNMCLYCGYEKGI